MSAQVILSSVSALCAGLLTLIRSRRKKQGVSALVIHKKGGKTRLTQGLRELQKAVVVDLDDVIERKEKHSSGEEYLLQAKEYVDELRKNFKNKHCIFLCNSVNTARFVGIKEKNIHYYAPSSDLFTKALEEITNTQKRDELYGSRTREIYDKPADKPLITFNTFDELKNMVCRRFNLQGNL